MNSIALLTALVSAVLAGVCVLTARLWHRLVPIVCGERESSMGTRERKLLHHGGTVGFTAFGGSLLTLGLYTPVRSSADASSAEPYLRVVTIGLLALALMTFLVASVGYTSAVARARRDDIR